MKCKECGKEYKNLHSHLRSHDGVAAYYKKHFPRYDYLTGEAIKFENPKQYFSSFFSSRANRNKFFREAGKGERAAFIKKEWAQHPHTKDLEFFPPAAWFEVDKMYNAEMLISAFGSIDQFCEEMKLKRPFWLQLPKSYQNTGDFQIWCDTREQKPWDFPNMQVQKLSVGDYCAGGDAFSKIAVDRKNKLDAYSSFGMRVDKTRENIELAREMGWKLIYVIEEPAANCGRAGLRFGERRGLTNFYRNVRKMIEEYSDTAQFVFCGNREEAKRLTECILFWGVVHFNTDWQEYIG